MRGCGGCAHPRVDARALAAVLHDPGIGGFEVRTLLNEPAHEVNLAVEEFFADRRPDDLLLVHFSCHGVKDEDGELYFAMANTLLSRLGATAVAADFVNRRMSRSRSRRVVLLLDCCYAGAFERGMTARAGAGVGIESQFGGRGRAVITASSAMEYAFEGDQLADASRAGAVGVHQRPGRWASRPGRPTGTRTAWSRSMSCMTTSTTRCGRPRPTRRPASGPSACRESWSSPAARGRSPRPRRCRVSCRRRSDSPFAAVRAAAVQELARLLQGLHAGLALAARLALEGLTEDDSRSVAAAATAALSVQAQQPGRDRPNQRRRRSRCRSRWSHRLQNAPRRPEAAEREILAEPQAPAAAQESEAAVLVLWTEGEHQNSP